MTCVVVHNAFGSVTTNGIDLPVDCSRGCVTPVTIETPNGDGEVYVSVNADPNISDAVYDSDGNLLIPAIQAAPVSVLVTDALGHVTTIDENTRYPEEGTFPLLHDPLVIT